MAGFDDPAFFGDRWASAYKDLTRGPDPTSAVEFLAGLAGGGRVLELAIGGGRVALPLARRGITVEGIEASEAVVQRLRSVPGGKVIPVVVAGLRHELADVPLVVGRSRDCDIAVDDPNVSRRHAEVRHEDGAYWIVDLGSTNGVIVNGKRVERAELAPDDEIVLGTTELRFERGF